MSFKMKNIRIIIALSLILFNTANHAFAKKKPNIVLIFADDLGWTGLGSYGSDFYETPNIDKLCYSGMKFTQGYAAATVCAPSRAALISGQYNTKNGTLRVSDVPKRINKYHLYQALQPANLPFEESQTTIAEALKSGGYATGMFGKWHLHPGSPGDHGFDEWVTSASKHFNFETSLNEEIKEGTYLSDYMADKAIEFIDKNKDNPFFLYLPDFLVHKPHEAKERLIQKYAKKQPAGGHKDPVYAAMTESLDETVGRIYNKLEDTGILENTLIIFTSDNGAAGRTNPDGTGMSKNYTDNIPLRDGKGLLYEGGIRVPYIFYWKNKIASGTSSEMPIIGVDLYPTLIDIAGIKAPKEHELDGISFFKTLLNPDHQCKERPLYWHYPNYGPVSYKNGQLKYAYIPTDAIRLGDYKLLEFYHDTTAYIELYNIAEDLGERNNLAEKMPEKAEELLQMLKSWRYESGARMPVPNPQFDKSLKSSK